MAETIPVGAQALVMDSRDHVATAIQELRKGDTITYLHQGETKLLEVLEAIPFGHKIAIADIGNGTEVRKYGEVIGRATASIDRGRHVHVHNVEGIRGRGDQAKTTGGGQR